MLCFIVLASIDQGGHVSFFLQLVKIPLLIIVNSLLLIDETPLNLGSLSELSKTSRDEVIGWIMGKK